MTTHWSLLTSHFKPISVQISHPNIITLTAHNSHGIVYSSLLTTASLHSSMLYSWACSWGDVDCAEGRRRLRRRCWLRGGREATEDRQPPDWGVGGGREQPTHMVSVLLVVYYMNCALMIVQCVVFIVWSGAGSLLYSVGCDWLEECHCPVISWWWWRRVWPHHSKQVWIQVPRTDNTLRQRETYLASWYY